MSSFFMGFLLSIIIFIIILFIIISIRLIILVFTGTVLFPSSVHVVFMRFLTIMCFVRSLPLLLIIIFMLFLIVTHLFSLFLINFIFTPIIEGIFEVTSFPFFNNLVQFLTRISIIVGSLIVLNLLKDALHTLIMDWYFENFVVSLSFSKLIFLTSLLRVFVKFRYFSIRTHLLNAITRIEIERADRLFA